MDLEDYCDKLSPHCGWVDDRSYECHCGNVRSSVNVTALADHHEPDDGVGKDRAGGNERRVQDRRVLPGGEAVPEQATGSTALLVALERERRGREREKAARLRVARAAIRARKVVDDYAQASVVFPGLRSSPLAMSISSLYDALAQLERSDLD